MGEVLYSHHLWGVAFLFPTEFPSFDSILMLAAALTALAMLGGCADDGAPRWRQRLRHHHLTVVPFVP
jgi:hypothetical protein